MGHPIEQGLHVAQGESVRPERVVYRAMADVRKAATSHSAGRTHQYRACVPRRLGPAQAYRRNALFIHSQCSLTLAYGPLTVNREDQLMADAITTRVSSVASCWSFSNVPTLG
jgi:hypothetical protein